MTEFQRVSGFEDIWRAPGVRMIPDRTIRLASPQAVKARLNRIASRAPEVVATVKGRMHAPRQLHEHLNYVTRRGELALETPDGRRLEGPEEVRELAEDWVWGAMADSHRSASTTISRSIVLSMPPGVDGERLEEAVRSFAARSFGETFDFAFVRHADAPNPHAHLVVRALGANGERFTPMKADLARWRETFAEALREQGIEAEATPRRARGVTLKAERPGLRRLRLLYEQGERPMPEIFQRAHHEADQMLGRQPMADSPWETAIRKERRKVVATYLVAAEELGQSPDPLDRALAEKLTNLVRDMPPPLTRQALLVQEKQARDLIETIRRERDDRLAAQERGRER